MKSTTLIQRLQPPSKRAGNAFALNPFAFGGGKRNGGVSEESMLELSKLFSFDYMGSAEYEFGALPTALKKMNDAKDKLDVIEVSVDLSRIKHPYMTREIKFRTTGTELLYVVGNTDDKKEIDRRVNFIALFDADEALPGNDDSGRYAVKLRDSCLLGSCLAVDRTDSGSREYGERFVAGLELDNGFLVTPQLSIAHRFLGFITGGSVRGQSGREVEGSNGELSPSNR